MTDRNFDELFTQVAGQLGGIQPLLNTFFSFLCRKTDFYVQFDPSVTKDANMGFPPGVAEKMLLDSFKKYPFRGLPPAEGAPPSPTTRVSRPHRGPKDTDSRPVKKIDEISSPDSTEANAATASALSDSEHSKLSTMQLNPDNGKQIPIGNGGYSENYYWTQTLGEVTVYVDVPTGTRGKQVDCVMKPRFLSLAVGGAGQGHGGSDEPLRLLGGDLEDVVRLDESLWTVASDDSSTQVIITLDKQRKTWWKHVLQGDPEIDTTKVDSQQKIDEYDEQTQATIRKLMFDQKQKRLGLPTSEDCMADEVLEKARSAPGSPFLRSSGGEGHT